MKQTSRQGKQKPTNARITQKRAKITYQAHPSAGQSGQVVDASYPMIKIRIADGSILTLPMSWTDYAKNGSDGGPESKGPLISTQGLLDVVEITSKAKKPVRREIK